MKIPLVMNLIAELAIKEGAAPLYEKYKDRCWERRLNDKLWIAFNGNDHPVKCTTGSEVPPFCVYGERLGFPALLVTPAGGSTGHPGWNTDVDVELEFIEAVQAILEDEE